MEPADTLQHLPTPLSARPPRPTGTPASGRCELAREIYLLSQARLKRERCAIGPAALANLAEFVSFPNQEGMAWSVEQFGYRDEYVVAATRHKVAGCLEGVVRGAITAHPVGTQPVDVRAPVPLISDGVKWVVLGLVGVY